MNTREIYKQVLIERECLRNRKICDKNCSGCDYGSNLLDRDTALKGVLDILKARDPELHFTTELEMLREVIQDEIKSKEVN